MTLVQLRHLVALAESGSFSRSAEACFVSQPALSRSIRALENELGQPLFDRTGHRVLPTAYGRELLVRARNILAEAGELRASAALVRGAAIGRLALGMASGPAALLTAPLLVHVAKHQPGLRVEVARGSAPLLLQELRSRNLDALVIEVRAIAPAPDLQVEALAQLRGAFMCRPGHALLRRRTALRFQDLQRYPIITTPLGAEVARELVAHYGPEAHPDACVALRSEDINSLVEVAMQSDAVLLAVRATAPGLAELTLAPVLRASATFGMVTRVRHSELPALALARRVMRQVLQQQAAAVSDA